MALVSPGVQVTIIDESFYTPAEPGTTPLIVVATATDKSNGSGTGTASGTLKANAGKAFKMTSQRDLTDVFGVPFFEKTPSNTPIHGSERNEYGLLAAYSFLGVSSSAFIVRADINLAELEGTAVEPGSEPYEGAWWVDTIGTAWGVFEWNNALGNAGGQKFAAKTPLVITDADATTKTVGGSGVVPKGSVGSIGDYCVVFTTGSTSKETAKLYFKSPGGGSVGGGNTGTAVNAGDWVLVGSPEWVASWPTVISDTVNTSLDGSADTFYINGTLISDFGSTTTTLAAKINSLNITGVYATSVNNRLYLYSDGATEQTGDSTKSGNIHLGLGTNTPLDDLGLTGSAVDLTGGTDILDSLGTTYYCPVVQQTPHTNVPEWKISEGANRPTGSVWVKTTYPGEGALWRVKRWKSATQAWVAFDAPLYANSHNANYYLDRSGAGANISKDAIYVQTNALEKAAYGVDGNTNAVDLRLGTAEFKVWRRAATGYTSITSSGSLTSGSKVFTMYQSIKGSAVMSAGTTISYTATADDLDTLAGKINAASFFDVDGAAVTSHVEASVTSTGALVISHKTGGEIRFTDTTGSVISGLFTPYVSYTGAGTSNFYQLPEDAVENTGGLGGLNNAYVASNWIPLSADAFDASNDTPLNEPYDGQLWYNNSFAEVDIMVHNGATWVGYLHSTSPYYSGTASLKTDPAGPIVAASAPTLQSDGTSLVNGDLWISTADMENYPQIYRWNTDLSTPVKWELVDKTDQITGDGVLFADARAGDSGGATDAAPNSTIAELLVSNFLDFDAPDPALYPKGMLLWNLRRSGGNVKIYRNNYIDIGEGNVRYDNTRSSQGLSFQSAQPSTSYWPDRWTTYSGNNEDGSGSFGRHAQRKVVQAALKSVIDTSEEIRDEERRNFNLIACPGYPETLSNLINLNIDRGQTAFVIGDTPLRLKSDATSLLNWGTNAALVTDNGDDGIVSYDEYCAVYYPNGFTTDLGGNNAVVPASHMMLKTYALSDNVSYPWFAPAGTRRGGITNATAVGYIDAASGEFQTVALNGGTRDTLYDLKINPIPFFVGVGLVAYGQKTRARNASALDRINVARLVVYLRSQLSKLARPYVFEPNDSITRDEIKGAVESLLLELVGLRALYDFAVVCDESNNTPSRIDRNELYVDIAIEPVKAVEFIYIPVRIKNTGEI